MTPKSDFYREKDIKWLPHALTMDVRVTTNPKEVMVVMAMLNGQSGNSRVNQCLPFP